MKLPLSTFLKYSAFTLVIALLAFFLPDIIIKRNAAKKTYDDAEEIRENRVGLVLGTTKLLQNGRVNLYYKYRVDAAVALYKAGKIDFVLVSGDNSRESYDEPTDFKNDLITKGIPAERIYLDYAGFRTLDSVVRAKEIFGLEAITIISQKFHNERAIYLAEQKGVAAIAFNAKDVSSRYGLKVKIREYFARGKVFIDLLLGVQPKFLGEKIEIK